MPNYVQGLLIVSTNTCATTIEWGLVELLKYPRVLKKIQDELDGVVVCHRIVNENDIPQLKYLQAIVKETFCLNCLELPLLLPNKNMKACEIGDYYILAKTGTFVNVWAIHQNPSLYENPFDFNLERFVGSEVDLKGKDFQLLPFGSRGRIFPGLSLGLMIMQIVLTRLIHSFTWKWPLGKTLENMDMRELFNLGTPKAIPLQTIIISRLPLQLYSTLKIVR
jgi:cytochrome P450